MADIFESPINTLSGEPGSLAAYKGKALLLVNVASRCGLTPQYTGLEKLQKEYGERGFSVLGFPCNQFLGQEPGTAEEIAEFCSTTYGVTFPMFEKIEVNGPERHPIYDELTKATDAVRRGRRHHLELREVPDLPRQARSSGGSVPRPNPRTRRSCPRSKVFSRPEPAQPPEPPEPAEQIRVEETLWKRSV